MRTESLFSWRNMNCTAQQKIEQLKERKDPTTETIVNNTKKQTNLFLNNILVQLMFTIYTFVFCCWNKGCAPKSTI